WPSWTLPVLAWAKQQGAVTGYAHSASGLQIIPEQATDWIFKAHDTNGDGALSAEEAGNAVLPDSFAKLDRDGNQSLSREEILSATDRAAEQLPNLGMPAMAGAGALELPITVSAGVCDFISSMDTARIQEWNMWYHVLNCGFPLKVSGETDFPCMSSTRVGQGRVYVQMGQVDELDFPAWCERIAEGKAYVSDGFAHALEFEVEGIAPGFGEVKLDRPGKVIARAKVAFAAETPETVAQGLVVPEAGRRKLGDTVEWNQTPTDKYLAGGTRLVELVVNGKPIASQEVPADGAIHDLEFEVSIEQSSWVALRQFPQLHTNPVNVIVRDKPIRASRNSALWCAEIIPLLWHNRERNIRPEEREAARAAYDRARNNYLQIAKECLD
ncbi:MAG TPA: CehA/McbA family metallohydrolase, partial [Planctomycetaceae bacterium]|nr:CehA/McbA family metallohydrolase [Planctomycetaceae bacterium]